MAEEKTDKSSQPPTLNPITAYRSEYTRRLNRVLDHISAHLADNLTLEELAQVANFSPYHFHRLFSAWMGETLGDYLRRRRVEIAATRLVAQPRVRVLQVALSVGFGSAEAFARAFKTRFGCSPTLWRLRQSALRSAKLKRLRRLKPRPLRVLPKMRCRPRSRRSFPSTVCNFRRSAPRLRRFTTGLCRP